MQPLSAKQIIDRLIELGETQESISKGVGIRQATISRIATGKIESPRMKNYFKLHNLLAAKEKEAAA